MTDESTLSALEIVAENIEHDAKKSAPGIIAHLEAYGAWTEEEFEKAWAWIEDRM